MEAIVAADRGRGIGYRGDLLVRLAPDLKRFRALTLGRAVILGRKTLETFPGGRPLPGRRNLILSRNPALVVPGAEVFSSAPALLAACPDDAVVIGGQSVYELLLPHCVRVHLTRIDAALPADTWFPPLEPSDGWRQTDRSEPLECDGTRFWYETWERTEKA